MKLLLLLPFLFLPMCATYEASVSSRSVQGYAKASGAGLKYTVTYR